MNGNIVILALGIACVSAFAAEPELPRQTFGETPFITGGIGEEELTQINAARADYNVRLLMAEKSGAYVSDVRVAIVDGKGSKVLEVASAGPYLLVKLPKGKYQINASYDGRSQERRLAVGDSGAQMLSFYW